MKTTMSQQKAFNLNSLIRYLGSDLSIPNQNEPNSGLFLSKYNLAWEKENAYITADPQQKQIIENLLIFISKFRTYSRGDIEVLDKR